MMNEEIQNLIDSNKENIMKIYLKLLDFSDDLSLSDDVKEIAAILKLYEILLMELKEKNNFENPVNVLKTLIDMKDNLESELSRLNAV